MKNIIQRIPVKGLFSLLMLSLVQLSTFAQDNVVVDKEEVGNWFEQNWMWVVGGVILLILIMLFSGGSRNKTKSTTVVKDQYGNKRVTTTETTES